MRLAGQMKGGFYPAPEEAVALAATYLRSPRQPFALLDPCAGEGAAILQLSQLLGCRQASTYAIELDHGRADTLRANLPDAHVLAPASFFGCRASLESFALIWINPPFDDGYGGHRVEEQFLHTATSWLMPGGVMALVCPEDRADEYSDVREHFAMYYENCMIVPFPEKQRQFQEVIVFGQKSGRPAVDARGYARRLDWSVVLAPKGFIYDIPFGPGPRTFQKVEPTEVELQAILAQSPLRTHLMAPPRRSLPRPPLPLGMGHVALLLASGHLDGVVQPPGKPAHVVRGTSRKREYIADVTEIDNEDGTTTTKTTIAERIELVVRTVDLTGNIQTLLDGHSQGEPPEVLAKENHHARRRRRRRNA